QVDVGHRNRRRAECATKQHHMGAFIGTDLRRHIVKNGLLLGEADLGASLRGATACWIAAACAAFGPNTEARNRLAGGRVRVKLSLKIFQVKSKVQNIYFLNFAFGHTDPPILVCSFQVADLMSRDTSTAVCRSTKSSVTYANELLQCDCHRPEYHRIKLRLGIGRTFSKRARGNRS